MGNSVIPDYSFSGININIVSYFFILPLNMSILRFGVGMDLEAKRENRRKGKARTKQKGHIFGRPIRKMCQKMSAPLLCLTQTFGPSQGDLFSL